MVGKRRKKALHKDFWQEIRKSRARFISIFCIVALGVAFFSGIQAASPDMRLSGDAYYNEASLMDLKVMATLGLTEDDVKAIQSIDGVESAEGAYSTDAICGENEKQKVLHIESMNQKVNQLTVTEGRLPEKSGECFLDSTFAANQGYEIGSTINMRQDGDSKLLLTETYTVVGLGKSPLYISFNRGNTTVGSGEVNGFAYVMPEDFDQEIFTQIYIRAHGTDQVLSYTDAYDNLIEKLQDKVEEIQEERCQIRYDEIVSEAQDKISDAEQELADGKKEADEKLADAKKKLDDGEKELADGRKQYEDGKKQLEDAKKEITDGRKQLADAKAQLADGREQLASAKAQLSDGQSQLSAAQAKLDDGWAQYNAGKKKYDAGKAKFDKAKQQIESGKKQIAAGRTKLEQKQKELTAGIAQVKDGQTAVDAQITQLESQIAQIQAGLEQLSGVEDQLAAAQQAYDQTSGAVQAAQEAVNSAQAAYDAAKQQVEAGELSEEELAGYEQALGEAQGQLETANGTLSQAQSALDACQQAVNQKAELQNNLSAAQGGLSQAQAKKTELAATMQNLNAGQKTIDQNRAQLDSQEAKLSSGEKELAANEQTLTESKEKLDASLAQLQSGQVEIDANREKLQSGQAEIEANEAKLSSGEAEIAANEKKLADGEKEIAENEQKLKDSEQKLADAEKELKDGKKEYEDGRKEAEDEIRDGEQKISDAKEELNDLKEPEWIITDRNDLPEYSDYGDNADRIKNIGQVFPVIFFLVAALISLTTMTRMVEEQRTQIGTMKALGYKKLDIASKYLSYAFLATAGGSVTGILIGEKILPYIIIKAYGMMYHNVSNSLQIHYEWKYALTASVAALVCTVGATILSCRQALAETPASLMRPPAPKEGKRILLERIPFLWKHLNFTWKSSLRNLFRYKKRLFMTIFGIAGSMALMLVGYGIQDSVSDIVNLQYANIQHYDGTIISDDDATEQEKKALTEELDKNEKLEHYTKIQLSKLTAPNGKSNLSVYVYVPENLDNFKKDVTLRNRKTKEEYELTDAGAAVSEKTAGLLDLKVGDELTVKKDDREYQVKIAVITENYAGHYVYMTPNVYKETFGEDPDYADIVFAVRDEYKDQTESIGQKIMESPAVLSISYTASTMDMVNRMLSTLGIVIIVLIVSAGMLAFVVLYNLNNINITERQRELATLKVLGFFDGEVSQYVLRENIILTIAGILFGAVFGILLHRYIIVTVEVDAVMFGRNIRPISFVYCAVITCIFSIIVNIFMHRKLKKIDMVESLKSVE